ncbi:MAG: Gfo/Idh/MocA family oxidoreductase, partial [Actinobacteria bacterium]|nr:Gfo/Idh/MocA family oxidoreductase [Actinomycetota bacterium]
MFGRAAPTYDTIIPFFRTFGARLVELAALEQGWHVVVEKPAFAAVEDFDAVAAAARQAGRLVLVAENYTYKPAVARLRRAIGSGAIGEVLLVSVNALERQRREGWRDDRAVCAGPLPEG